MNDVIKMGFGEIEGLVASMKSRVGRIGSITDELRTTINGLGAENAGMTHEAMTTAFGQMHNSITAINEVIDNVHRAVHTGKEHAVTNEGTMSSKWGGGQAV